MGLAALGVHGAMRARPDSTRLPPGTDARRNGLASAAHPASVPRRTGLPRVIRLDDAEGGVGGFYFENTNLPIGPSSGPSGSGRHKIVSSILRAIAKSLSVMPPAEWVASFTQSLPHVTLRSA
jgi:hypothetical protein